MPVVDVNGTAIDFPDELSPDDLQKAVASAAGQIAPAARQKTLQGFAKNTISDYAQNAKGQAEIGAYAFPPFALMKAASGTNIYDPNRVAALGKGIVQGLASIPGQLKQLVTNPVDTAYNQPLTSAMNASIPLELAGRVAADVGSSAGGAIAKRALPPALRTSAGIPEAATEIALQKPQIFNQPPVPQEQLNAVVGEPVIDAMKQMKQQASAAIDPVFRQFADMAGPKDEIVNSPQAQKLIPIQKDVPVAQNIVRTEIPPDLGGGKPTVKFEPGDVVMAKQTVGFRPGKEFALPPDNGISYPDLIANYNIAKRAFEDGDQQALKTLFKKYISPNADVSEMNIRPQDQAQILTRIKRQTQALADFNKAPVTNAPIDTAKDAAFKQISSDVDKMRDQLPGGKQLANADQTWKNLNDIFDHVRKDLSDPGKSRDTMMRILRGDTTWLTNGRVGAKVDAIKKIESATGQDILQPALEEMTRQYFNDVAGKGFVSRLFQGGSIAGALSALSHPASLVATIPAAVLASPRMMRGAIRAGSAFGTKAAEFAPSALESAGTSGAFLGNALSQRRKNK